MDPAAKRGFQHRMRPSLRRLCWPLLVAVALLFLTALFKHISYPLIWHDESDTVMFAQRVLEYGYPKVHGPKNIVYGLEGPDLLVDARTDAYTGAPWSGYYFGSIGVALARGVDDLYEKTALLRIPFAVIGTLGMFLFLISVLDSVGSKASRRIVFSIQYWALATYSVSFLLHLREARYYSSIIFLSAALLLVFVRHHIYGRMAFGRYFGCVTLLLFLIFNTFYPAYPVFLIAIGIHHLWEAFFVKESGRVRWRWLLRSSSPLLLSLFTTLPQLSQSFSRPAVGCGFPSSVVGCTKLRTHSRGRSTSSFRISNRTTQTPRNS